MKPVRALLFVFFCEAYYHGFTVPTISLIFSIFCSVRNFSIPSHTFIGAYGSLKIAVPICTADAPAIIISIASSAVAMPPIPITGILTAFATCHTILTATGNTAGPESPPTLLCRIGRLVLISILIPSRVFISETLSAPSASTAFAISVIFVTLGVSFTITGFL